MDFKKETMSMSTLPSSAVTHILGPFIVFKIIKWKSKTTPCQLDNLPHPLALTHTQGETKTWRNTAVKCNGVSLIKEGFIKKVEFLSLMGALIFYTFFHFQKCNEIFLCLVLVTPPPSSLVNNGSNTEDQYGIFDC